MIIYKSFIWPHLDYDDVVYDRAFNESFHQSLESLQYSAAIAITDAIRGTSSAFSRTRPGNPKIRTLTEKIMSVL